MTFTEKILSAEFRAILQHFMKILSLLKHSTAALCQAQTLKNIKITVCSTGLRMLHNSCRASKGFAFLTDSIIHESIWKPAYFHLFFKIYLHLVNNRTQELRTKKKLIAC